MIMYYSLVRGWAEHLRVLNFKMGGIARLGFREIGTDFCNPVEDLRRGGRVLTEIHEKTGFYPGGFDCMLNYELRKNGASFLLG